MGADRGINLSGDGLGGADDAVVTRVLAAAVGRLGDIDLILTGATTLDTGQSQLGPRLAGALNWPQIVDAWVVRVVGGHVEIVCQNFSPSVGEDRGGGSGYVILEADLPAVVTVHPGALKPRYPNGVRLINVYRDQGAVEQWDVAELVDTSDLAPLLEKRGQDFPPERERGVRVSGTPEEVAQTLAGALRKRLG
jgi:electron transfer flavoprotein beta subunit